MTSAFQRIDTSDGIAQLYFDLPGQKINVFNAQVFDELETLLDSLQKDRPKALIIFSRKKGIFIAGADINEFLKIKTFTEGVKASRRGQLIFERIHNLPFPSIVVINGACMGGGTELSLACTYRLAVDDPKTKIALPEVKLGILPGWGGTQRLPKIVGLQSALDIILTGKNLNAQKALRLGLVDAVLAPEKYEEQALQFTREVLAGSPGIRQKGEKAQGILTTFLEKTSFGRKMIFNAARKNVLRKTFGNYPAPLKALQVIEQTYVLPLTEGLKIEADALAELILTMESKNLVTLFLWQDALKKKASQIASGANVPKGVPVHLLARDAYSMDLVQWLILKGFKVFVLNEDPVRLQKLETMLRKQIEELARRKRLTEREAEQSLKNLTFSALTKLSQKPTWLLIDDPFLTADENEWLAQNEVENVLVTVRSLRVPEGLNTVKKNGRWLTIQVYNPVNRSQIVEIGSGGGKAAKSLSAAFGLIQSLGKIPVRLHSNSELLFNTLLIPYLLEAIKLAYEGFLTEEIERTMLKFGMVSSPLALIDVIGIDVLMQTVESNARLMEDYAQEINILQKMTDVGWTGRKAGKGFYKYEGKKKKRNFGVDVLLQKKPMDDDARSVIETRLVGMLLNKAVQAWAQNTVESPMELDAAAVFAFGFAPFRGGILRYADQLGAEKVLQLLQTLQQKYGVRFQPHALWSEMASSGRKFYPEN